MPTRVVLLGHPVAHTLSEALQRAAFSAAGVDATYEPVDTPTVELSEAIVRLRGETYLGASIGAPHKERVVPMLDRLTDDAQRTGAVDTVTKDGSQLVGHNTEVLGFRLALDQLVGNQKMPKAAVVLGAGGGARAVVHTLIAAGFLSVVVFNRHLHRAERLVRHFGRSASHMDLKAKPWHESVIEAELAKTDILVNASAVGRDPEESPLAAELLPPEILVLDLHSVPEETKLLRDAAAAGATRVMNGDVMLLGQSAAAYELWTGQKAPLDIIRAQLETSRDEPDVPVLTGGAADTADAARVTAVGTTTRLELERRFAIEVVMAASRLTRAVRRDLLPGQAVSKADASPVTVADLAAQSLVRLALADVLPADGLMGEEDATPLRGSDTLTEMVLLQVRAERPGAVTADVLDALDRCDDPGGAGRRFWTLDPVDGTKGFLRGEQYAVALALVEDGEVVLAAMGCPNLPLAGEPGAKGTVGCLFVAERGGGTWQRPLFSSPVEAGGRRLSVAAVSSVADGRYAESVEAAHSDQSGGAAVARRLGITAEPLRLDSQTKYAVVARGDASIYLRLPHGGYRENLWDHAAGTLIVSEAGGRVSDVDGRPLDLTTGQRMTANRGIVATAAAIHDAVLEAVREVSA